MIVSDNGSELTSQALLRYQQQRGVAQHYIAQGKPQQNGFVESFNVSAATRPLARRVVGQPLSASAQQQGTSSSMRLLGQPLTSRVSISVK